MARKSKRMAINEAIRQGQAKIAEGLKTGQMRSDNPHSQGDSGSKDPNLDGVAPGRAGFLTSKKKSTTIGHLSNKVKVVLLLCVVVLAAGSWLVAFLVGRDGDEPSTNPAVQDPLKVVSVPKERIRVQEQKETDSAVPDEIVSLPIPKGDNVICIQSIALSRKAELNPVAEFFKGKGIETEIIVHRVSGDAILVTKAGFEQNPASKGTQGYELLERIKQLGIDYVQETKDTKFGTKPFQDAYGYKR